MVSAVLPQTVIHIALRTLAVFVVFFTLFSTRYAYCEDVTVNYKTYHNIVWGQVEADKVHITFDGGTGSILLKDLSPDLQARFGYDPTKAAAALADEDAKRVALAKQLNPHPVDMTNVAVSVTPPGGLTPEQVLDIQERIEILKWDIAEKKKLMRKDRPNGVGGGYTDIINDETAQREALIAQLPKPQKPAMANK